MDATSRTDDDQTRAWNGPSGRAWVETLDLLDQVFTRFDPLLVDEITVAPGGRVLDVGCGTGGTTLAVARALGAQGRSVGIDISEQMIAAARARAERSGMPAEFVAADAQDYAFEPASFDAIVSRFGVMFFDDPVEAFGNLRRAAKHRARLRLAVWRSVEENRFMTTAERAAAHLLPDLPPRRADAPGQFAFADRRRVEAILRASGWEEIDLKPIAVECSTSRDELVRYLTWLGPVGAYLQRTDEPTRRRVIEAILPAFDPYLAGDRVSFTAACWLINARAP